jgi:dihydroorotate dehydrogenase (fumarate)
MNTEIKLMGIDLANPIIVGSSSLTNSVKNIKLCEKYGAGAVVLKSLYEEQILADLDKLIEQDDMFQWYPEAMDFVNSIAKDEGIHSYLNLIKNAKAETGIPIIASINCITTQEWPKFARELENAGADAIELNIGIFPENAQTKSETLEGQYIDILNAVTKQVKIPVSIKLSTYFTNIRRMVSMLSDNGAAGVVLFNRYYRPDIDIDTMKMVTRDTLSGPEEITLSLRWVGILSSDVSCELIASTGVHDASGAIKQLLAGAGAVQVCSTLYENGIAYVGDILSDMQSWMKRKGFGAINDFKGLINKDVHNTASWERIHFIKKSIGNIIKPINMH